MHVFVYEDYSFIINFFTEFQISETVQEFREWKQNPKKMLQYISELAIRLKTLPISTAECERGFSFLNRQLTSERNRLLVNSVR